MAEAFSTIEHLLAAQAARRPDAPALVVAGGPPVTYRRLHQQTRDMVSNLHGTGIARADRVAVVLPNGPGMAVAFLGVSAAAACAPLNPSYTASEFDFYLADLDARAVVVPFKGESPVREVARARGIAVLELYDDLAFGERVFTLDAATRGSAGPEDPPGPSAVALVLHTSGTTSRPKMIRLTHANLCASAASIASTLALGEDDRCLNVMPLFHIHGLVGALLSSLAAGASVVCTPGFSAAQFFAWLEEFRPTWYTAVPTMHQEVLARAAAHQDTVSRCPLRLIRSSSAALSPNVMSGIERAFGVPLIEAFGMTEASHQIASNPPPPGRRKPGSVGLPAGCEVAILDDRGAALPCGSHGEISIRGPGVTGFPPATGDATPEPTADSWFRTGDLGYLDEDGYLFIAGRLKEIINRGGEKIAPAEVDQVLLEHPAVGQVVTCAVPDTRFGEDVVAVVVRRIGASLTETELRAFALSRLAAFKVPRRVVFVEQIPTGPTGKVQRIGLAGKLGLQSLAFAQSGAAAAYAAPSTPAELAIAEVWREVLEIERVGLFDNFFELGGDSLAGEEVIAQVEARLGVTINIRDLGFGTLQQLAAGSEVSSSRAPVRRHGRLAPLRWAKMVLQRLRSGR